MKPWLEKIVYAPLSAALHLLALMPWWVIYLHADVAYFIIYHVVRYRRGVVRNNLTESFPDKSTAEIIAIEKEFYRHLSDYFFETMKLMHISDDEMRKRMTFGGTELVDEAFDQGRSVMMYAAHYANWEWTPSITLWCRHKPGDKYMFSQVYRPLRNKWFDDFFFKLRGRFHSVSYPKNTVFRDMLKDKHDGKLQVIGFIADQHPNINDQGHVIEFLNHPTAMITGAEAIARKLDMRVCYFDVSKLSRGHFHCEVTLVCDQPSEVAKGEITDRYARLLESRINSAPAYWLWTHKRWKNKVELPTESNQGTATEKNQD